MKLTDDNQDAGGARQVPLLLRRLAVRVVIEWIRSWWITWRVWRNADAEQRRIMTEPFNPDDYIEVQRPGEM